MFFFIIKVKQPIAMRCFYVVNECFVNIIFKWGYFTNITIVIHNYYEFNNRFHKVKYPHLEIIWTNRH